MASITAHVATAIAVDTFWAPLVTSALEHYLVDTLLGPQTGLLATVARLLLCVQSLSFVSIIQRRMFGGRAYTLENKHVLVTGGSQGLGLDIARQCLKQGARVTVVVS